MKAADLIGISVHVSMELGSVFARFQRVRRRALFFTKSESCSDTFATDSSSVGKERRDIHMWKEKEGRPVGPLYFSKVSYELNNHAISSRK